MNRREIRPNARHRAARRPRPTGAQRVYEALRHAIIALELEPGAALEEATLCRQFDVSRTPVREALIRLASEGLVDLEPNRGAKMATLQFIDVVDHYEAMDVFQPVICHFAAVRHTDGDLAAMTARLRDLRRAVARRDAESIIRANYDLHCAIATAAHNRSLANAYRQMLVDKLRIAQHTGRGRSLAERFLGTHRILERLVRAIGTRDTKAAERLARELNGHIRGQVVAILSASLGREVAVPIPAPRERDFVVIGGGKLVPRRSEGSGS
ncbi:MAG: GntR family transcriptional regulator [Alphaproteobacteria bacterium]|nr:GntR family transcriptional regulator [Alphaproteobacteria bacterium]